MTAANAPSEDGMQNWESDLYGLEGSINLLRPPASSSANLICLLFWTSACRVDLRIRSRKNDSSVEKAKD